MDFEKRGLIMKKITLKKWMYDFILSIAILIVVAAALVYSYVLESPRVTLFLARPDTYMAMWFIILAILALILMFRALKARKTSEGQADGIAIWCGVGVVTVIILFVYLLTLEYLGFFLGSALMLWTITMTYTFNIGVVKKDWRDKRLFVKELVKTGVFSFAASYITFWIFTSVLTSKLPTFSLF